MKFGFKHVLIIMLASGVLACSGGGSGGGTDGGGGGGTQNSAPVANAGVDQTVNTGSVVTLDASGSNDANNDTLTYLWSVGSAPAGSSAALSDTSISAPTFTADVSGTYVFNLFVNDGTVNSLGNSVSVVASVPNVAPVANAGTAQNVSTGSVVTLDGSASSDANGDALTYAWTLTKPAGSSAVLDDASSAAPKITVDTDGVYAASLIVNDGNVDSSSVTVQITASTTNSAPVANAGVNQNVVTGSVVTLDGTASTDADGPLSSYAWTLTKPATSSAVLDDASSPTPKFTVDIDGSYVATLIVNDGTVDSASASVEITASAVNSAPTANAGVDQNVLIDNEVMLDGTASADSDGDTITYLWTLTSGPASNTATIEDATMATAKITPDVVGTYVVQLIVNDGTVSSVADTVTVTIAVGNSAPVANAGADQVLKTSVIALLDGSASSDANGDGLQYTWSFVSVPTGSAAAFDDNEVVNPSFTTDLEGSYVISLAVSDTMDTSQTDTIIVRVTDAEITLSERIVIGGNTFREVPFPFEIDTSFAADVVGSPPPTTVTIKAYRIISQGGDLTIKNLRVVNDTNSIVPFFSGGLEEGFILRDGVEADFGLVSPLTGGDKIQLHFSFEIAETGEVFTSSYLFSAN